MNTVTLTFPTSTSPAEVLAQVPADALLDSTLTATLLDTTVDALAQHRRSGKGLIAIHLSRRRVRYRAGDVLARLAETNGAKS